MLLMTYPEFLARRGLRPSPIPEALLRDEEGQPKQRTDAEWAQLDELYAGSAVKEEAPKPGRTGSALLQQVQQQLAVIKKENLAVARAFAAAGDGFTFEVGYPQYDRAAVNAQNLPVRIGVLMHVKPSLQKSYGATVYRLLKPFDNYGTDRRPFTFVTYQGGYFHPSTFTLHPTSIALWNALWATPQVALVLQDSRGKPVEGASGTANAGLNGNAPALIAYPPEIRRTPYFDYVMPMADRDFTGSRRIQVDFARGWYYEYNFTLDLEKLALLDRASATLVLPPYSVLSAAIAQARTPAEIQSLVTAAVNDWVAKTGADFLAGRGAGAAAGAQVSGAAEEAAPRAGAPPPGVRQLAPGGAGPGYSVPTAIPTAPLPL
jgi:hypothetical protein